MNKDIKSKEWYYLHPKYKQHLKNVAVKNKVLLQGDIVIDVDAFHLLDIGCINCAEMRFGELILCTSYKSLIFKSKFDILKNYCNSKNETNWIKKSLADVVLNQIFNKQNKKIKEFILEETIGVLNDGEEIFALLLLKYYYKDNNKALMYIRKTSDLLYGLSALSKKVALIYPLENFLFQEELYLFDTIRPYKIDGFIVENNLEIALKLIEEKKENAKSSSEYLECFNLLVSYSNKIDDAEICISKAEKTNNSRELCNCAKSQILYLGMQKSKVEKLLNNAGEMLKNSLEHLDEFTDIMRVASSWIHLIADENKGLEYLKKAVDKVAKSSIEFLTCARLYYELGNNIEMEKCIIKAGNRVHVSVKDYLIHAEMLFKLNNTKLAIKWVSKAKSIACSTEDWIECAEADYDLFNSVSECKLDYRKAKKCIKTDADENLYTMKNNVFTLIKKFFLENS